MGTVHPQALRKVLDRDVIVGYHFRPRDAERHAVRRAAAVPRNGTPLPARPHQLEFGVSLMIGERYMFTARAQWSQRAGPRRSDGDRGWWRGERATERAAVLRAPRRERVGDRG